MDIESKNVVLHELERSHLLTLYKWRNEEIFLENCTMRKEPISFNEFCTEIDKDFKLDRHTQFVAFRKRDGTPIGTIWSYAHSIRDKYCFVSTYIPKCYKNRGYGVEVFSVFLKHLFDTYQLYKVYADVYGTNQDSLKILQKATFKIEGIFKGHRLFNDARCDLIRLAFFIEQKNTLTNFISKLNISERRKK